MLLYKAWLESRVRFLVSGVTLAWLCLVFVLWEPSQARSAERVSYVAYIGKAVYDGAVRDCFVVVVLLLGLGGLLQERARGTASFTLALPASRGRLIGARAAIGFAETAALAFVPAFMVAGGSPLVGESYPLVDLSRLGISWSGVGAGVFAASLLLSIVIPGEFVAPPACFVALFAYLMVVSLPPLREYPSLNIFATMNEITPLPWLRLAGIGVVAVGLLVAGAIVTERQDF